MKNFKELKENDLQNVNGGVLCEVKNDVSAVTNIRETPGLDGLILAKVPNGTMLRTTGKVKKADGFTWYEVTLATGSDNAWISGSMIGF